MIANVLVKGAWVVLMLRERQKDDFQGGTPGERKGGRRKERGTENPCLAVAVSEGTGERKRNTRQREKFKPCGGQMRLWGAHIDVTKR